MRPSATSREAASTLLVCHTAVVEQNRIIEARKTGVHYDDQAALVCRFVTGKIMAFSRYKNDIVRRVISRSSVECTTELYFINGVSHFRGD